MMNSKVGRNEKCPCGSGKKFKKCCLEKDNVINVNSNGESIRRIKELIPNSYTKNSMGRTSKNQKLGNKMMDDLLKNKNEIREILKTVSKNGIVDYFKFFGEYIYTPYYLVGNMYHQRFKEYYDFISEFSLGSIRQEDRGINSLMDVYRVMSIEEYNNLINGGGIESPSFTKNVNTLFYFFNNNILFGITKKNVMVKLTIKVKDIICIPPSKEDEVLLKKGIVPNSIEKFFEYSIDDVIKDYGENIINHIPIPNSVNNFYTEDYIKSLGFSPNDILRDENKKIMEEGLRSISINTLQKVS